VTSDRPEHKTDGITRQTGSETRDAAT